MVSVEADNLIMTDAMKATENLSLMDLPEDFKVGPLPTSDLNGGSFPFKDIKATDQNMSHFFDYVTDIPIGDVDVAKVEASICNKHFDDLPMHFKFKESTDADIRQQYFLLPQGNDKVYLIKHCYCKAKLTGAQVINLCRGEAKGVMWGRAPANGGRKPLQWLLEQLGGTQWRLHSIACQPAKKKQSCKTSPDEDEQDRGWEFILNEFQTNPDCSDKTRLRQMRWLQRELGRDSPIKGWNEKLVQRALDSLANDGALAALMTRYDLTVKEIADEVREVIEILVPYFRTHSLWILGEAGKGKTPIGRIIAMLFSRYRGGTGAFRTASDFD